MSPVLDAATRLLLVVPGASATEELAMPEAPAAERARALASAGVTMVLCGGISEELRQALECAGILVVPHLCGPVVDVLHAYHERRLPDPDLTMPGCCGRRCPCRQRREQGFGGEKRK